MAEIINMEKTLKITEVAEEEEDEIVEKPKRKMTDKQKEALARGRLLAQQKRRKDKDDLENLKLDKKLDELKKESNIKMELKDEKKPSKKKKNSRPKKTKPPTPPSSDSEYSEEESESSESESDDDEPPPRKVVVEKPKKKKPKPKNIVVEQRLPPKPTVHFL